MGESLCNYLLLYTAGDNDSEDQVLRSKEDVLEESQLQNKNRFYKLGWFQSRSDVQS